MYDEAVLQPFESERRSLASINHRVSLTRNSPPRLTKP